MLSRSPTPLPTPHSRSVVLYILSLRLPLLATLYFRQARRDFNSPCISKLVKQMFPRVISYFKIRKSNSNSKFVLQKNSSHSRNMFLKHKQNSLVRLFQRRQIFGGWYICFIFESRVRISVRNFLYQPKLLLDLSVPSS